LKASIMAQLVLGIGISHTPMLNGSLEDWPRFIEADRARSYLDKEGNTVSYEDFLAQADAAMAEKILPEKLAARHGAAMANLQTIRDAIQAAALDTLIVIGDDQNELYEENNTLCFLIYRGETIRNVPPRANPKRPNCRAAFRLVFGGLRRTGLGSRILSSRGCARPGATMAGTSRGGQTVRPCCD